MGAGCVVDSYPEAIRDDARTGAENLDAPSAVDALVERFAEELAAERVSSGQVNLKTASFREFERLSHDVGRRIAQQLGRPFTSRPCGELSSDDDHCPTCGLECEAVKQPRRVETIDGPADVVELKSFCRKCRRNFFPVRSVTGLDHRVFSPLSRDKIITAGLVRGVDSRVPAGASERRPR